MTTEQRRKLGTSSILGVILIIIGLLFLLNNLEIMPHLSDYIVHPSTFILIIGIIILLNTNNSMAGIILTTIGTLLVIGNVFNLDGEIIVPLIIILMGIAIILRKRSPSTINNMTTLGVPPFQNRGRILDKDMIDEVSIFGGGHRVVKSDNFKGGSITAIFGGCELDLTQCQLADGDVVVDVLFLFGGGEVIVPSSWDVQIQVTSIFGGFSHKNRQYNREVDTTRRLIVKGLALFGGGEIKSYF